MISVQDVSSGAGGEEEGARGEEDAAVVYTREKTKDAGIGVTELLSHKLHGIDNTGNVKVWEAESILVHLLLSNPFFAADFADK